MTEQVPLVHLTPALDAYFNGDKDNQEGALLIKSIGDSLKKWGFVSIAGHGVEDGLFTQAYQVATEVFSLSHDQKKHYEDADGGRQRGYTPLLMEKAKGQSASDLKEFWHIGRELPSSHPYRVQDLMRANLYPKEVPQFKDCMQKLYRAMDNLAHRMLKVIEYYLEIEDGALSALADQGNSVLRVLNYPDLKNFASRTPGSVRAAAHEDINLLTLLPAATRPGLQLLTKEGTWLDITPPPGTIILDTGDMMSAVTGGIMPATTHRVINPEGESDGGRLSMPFFMHPRPDAVLNSLLNNENSVEGIGLTAQEFLNRRLAENGLS